MLFDPKREGKLSYTEITLFTRPKRLILFLKLPKYERSQSVAAAATTDSTFLQPAERVPRELALSLHRSTSTIRFGQMKIAISFCVDHKFRILSARFDISSSKHN